MTTTDRLAEAVAKLPLVFGPDKYGISTCPWCGGVWELQEPRHKSGCVYEEIRDAITDYRNRPPVDSEALVDAVGAALGVDTGACHENQFRAACDAASAVLREAGVLDETS